MRKECEWLQERIDTLSQQAEELEAELEQLADARKRDTEEAMCVQDPASPPW